MSMATDTYQDVREKLREKYLPLAASQGLDATDVDHVLGHFDFAWMARMVGERHLWAEADHWMPRYLDAIANGREAGLSAAEACIGCNLP